MILTYINMARPDFVTTFSWSVRPMWAAAAEHGS
jgi:hypothetical protein